jgi:hypothetical protein
VLPEAIWRWERLEKARSLVAGGESSSARMTIADISFYVSQHAFPVVPVFEEPVRLVFTKVGSRDLIINFPDQVGT